MLLSKRWEAGHKVNVKPLTSPHTLTGGCLSGYLCGLVVSISSHELLSRAAIGGVGGKSVGQGGGGSGIEWAGGRGRGGGGGGLGLQAVEGVAPRSQHHSHPGQEPAPELILAKQINICSAGVWKTFIPKHTHTTTTTPLLIILFFKK